MGMGACVRVFPGHGSRGNLGGDGESIWFLSTREKGKEREREDRL